MSELVLISGENTPALLESIDRLAEFINRYPAASLADIAYTCALEVHECVLAVVASGTGELRERILSAKSRIAGGSARLRDKSGTYYLAEHLLGSDKGKLAFVYPGVMGFYPDMLRDLAIRFTECRGSFDELEEAMVGDVEFTPSTFVFPPAAHYRHDADIFKSGAYAQALVSTYAACVALSRLLLRSGIEPDGVVGFAGGDLAAVMRSGAAGGEVSRPERIRIVKEIYRIVHKAVNHGGLPEVRMVTVLLRRAGELDAVMESFPSDKVMLAVDFSPRQKTLAIAVDFAEEAMRTFATAGIRAMPLELDRPFNTPLCEELVPAVRKFVVGLMKQEAVCDVYSCSTAEKLPGNLKAAREDTAERWARPVRFEETIRRMYADGYRVFLEVGPRGLMTAAISDTLKGEKFAAIALNSIHRSGVLQLQHAVGQLIAAGAKMDVARLFRARGLKRLDFSSTLPMGVHRDVEMRLSRALPRLTLLSNEGLDVESPMATPKGKGARANDRAAAMASHARKQRQFDFGALNPLISDSDTVEQSPGMSISLVKNFKLEEMPFLADYALGSSQMSYADPNLKGLVPLQISVGAELAAEVAVMVMPNRVPIRIEGMDEQRRVSFTQGALCLYMYGERGAATSNGEATVKVVIRDEASAKTGVKPVMEAMVVMAESLPQVETVNVAPLMHPRGVHWSGREIYPARLCAGSRLRGIAFAENWSESGLDYQVEVPELSGNVAFTRFPLWAVNPMLLKIVSDGFSLWRSHEKFEGAFSFPYRMRRLALFGRLPREGELLKCYMRLSGVTPKSHICDITVTDGNGLKLMEISGWEELTERVPREYREMILRPAMSYLTAPIDKSVFTAPSVEFATSYITDVPYNVLERNDELWMRTLSGIILGSEERQGFATMSGQSSRRAEWLFGRAAVKEAVRRYLNEFYQARWSDADVRICANSDGKPQAIGRWKEYLSGKLDVAISHTSQFIVAVAAANARVGVDVESVTRTLSDEFINSAFAPEEQEVAAKSLSVPQTQVKFWCAKEAVSKALGVGIAHEATDLRIIDFVPETGELKFRLLGKWDESFKRFRGFDICAQVKIVRDHALAVCFIPDSMFDD